MTASLEQRARRIRERLLIRAWEYRQRQYSKGVWFRLRRALVDAGQAWVVAEQDADRLEALGHVPLAVGRELFPPKRIFFLSEADLPRTAGCHQVPVRLTAELLEATDLVLIRYVGRAGQAEP